MKRRYLYFVSHGEAGTYDDVKDDIRINKNSLWFRFCPKIVLNHELRHMVYYNFLHPEERGNGNWFVLLKSEIFAGFPFSW